MKLKRYKKKKFSDYISRGIIIIILSLSLSFFVIDHIAMKADKILFPLGVSKTKQYITKIINHATENIDMSNDLFSINKDENDEIKMITYNTMKVTKLIDTITFNVEKEIMNLEDEVIEEIPFGVIFDNSFLRNLGPRIKLKLDIVGDVVSNIETEVKPYGINNAYVEMRIFIQANARVKLPFVSEIVSVSQIIPISMNVVSGTVPEAYISSFK